MNFTFLTEEEKGTLSNQYKRIQIIGLSFLSSLPIYIVISNLITVENTNPSNSNMRYIFLMIALLIAFIIRIIRRMILSKIDRPIFINLVQRLLLSSIITLTLCESVALIGFVEYFIMGLKMDFYLMLLLSMVFFAVHFPRKSLWEAYINSHIREFTR